MNDSEASNILKSMIQFIRSHGDERAHSINKQADDEFTAQKENFIAEEKERLTTDIGKRLQSDEIKLRIEKSAVENLARINKMRTVNELIEKIYAEARKKITERQKSDVTAYKELCKNLIVQGLIKFMEGEVNVRCRKSDHKVVQSVMQQAEAEYKALMKKEVKHFEKREVPLKLTLDDDKFLAEYDPKCSNSTGWALSCNGGLVLHCRKGRIVCSNTLDDRLQLVFQEAIPQIRENLFPSFKKPEQDKSKQETHSKHH